jgi:hypothetical protein
VVFVLCFVSYDMFAFFCLCAQLSFDGADLLVAKLTEYGTEVTQFIYGMGQETLVGNTMEQWVPAAGAATNNSTQDDGNKKMKAIQNQLQAQKNNNNYLVKQLKATQAQHESDMAQAVKEKATVSEQQKKR